MVKNDGVEVFEFVEQGKQCDSESQIAKQTFLGRVMSGSLRGL